VRAGDLQENKIVRMLSRSFDLLVLNILCLIAALPVITAGASLTALYSVTMKMVSREEGYIIRDFFRAFRKNLRTGIIETLAAGAVEALIVMDAIIVSHMNEGTARMIMTGMLLFAELIWLVTVTFLFPLTAISDKGPLENIRTAAVIPLASMPDSLPVIAVTGASVVLTMLNQTTIMFSAVIWVMIGIAALAYINSQFLCRILQPYQQ
jgi:uncharacterized membrane protein YesL